MARDDLHDSGFNPELSDLETRVHKSHQSGPAVDLRSTIWDEEKDGKIVFTPEEEMATRITSLDTYFDSILASTRTLQKLPDGTYQVTEHLGSKTRVYKVDDDPIPGALTWAGHIANVSKNPDLLQQLISASNTDSTLYMILATFQGQRLYQRYFWHRAEQDPQLVALFEQIKDPVLKLKLFSVVEDIFDIPMAERLAQALYDELANKFKLSWPRLPGKNSPIVDESIDHLVPKWLDNKEVRSMADELGEYHSKVAGAIAESDATEAFVSQTERLGRNSHTDLYGQIKRHEAERKSKLIRVGAYILAGAFIFGGVGKLVLEVRDQSQGSESVVPATLTTKYTPLVTTGATTTTIEVQTTIPEPELIKCLAVKTYIVAEGDNLTAIGERCDPKLSLSQLLLFNPQFASNPDDLRPGDVVYFYMQEATTSMPSTTVAPTTAPATEPTVTAPPISSTTLPPSGPPPDGTLKGQACTDAGGEGRVFHVGDPSLWVMLRNDYGYTDAQINYLLKETSMRKDLKIEHILASLPVGKGLQIEECYPLKALLDALLKDYSAN